MTAQDNGGPDLDASVLIVAHPDDEILWFGAIVQHVDRIVVCFLHDPDKPDMAAARRRVLAAHPFRDRIDCLELTETTAFGLADWVHPVITQSGLALPADRAVDRQYRQRARELETALEPHLARAINIFTHNPWGEYGHEEHVMVHRVVTALAARSAGKQVWFSNYASSWSTRLMLRYLTTADTTVRRGDVDTAAMQGIAEIYRRCDAWTWFDDYRWFEREYFVRGPLEASPGPGFGWLCPVNLIHLPDRRPRRPAPGFLGRIRRAVRRRMPGDDRHAG